MGASRLDRRLDLARRQLLPGGSLADILGNHVLFDAPTACFCTACASAALAFLHEHHIVCRDLKPANLMVDGRGYPKHVGGDRTRVHSTRHLLSGSALSARLSDFGLSKEVDGPTRTVCGTPDFVAPEILRGKGYSFAVDWCAQGWLLLRWCGMR